MSQVENLVEANTKDELVALAEEYDLDSSGNKADIAERIYKFEAGVPQEAVIEEPVVEETAVEDDEEQTLVHFKGSTKWYEQGGYRFTSDKPFRLVSASVADVLFDSNPVLFAPASRKQVEEYYS